MKTSTKVILFAAFAVALAIGAYVFRKPTGATSTTPIVVLIPETGPAAEYARYSRMGFDLGVAAAKRQGLPNLELVYADTKSNPKDGLSALQQALVSQKPVLVISLLSSVTKAIAPVMAEQGVPVIANAVAAPGLAKPEQGLFRVFPTSSEVSALACDRLKELGRKRVVIVYVNDEYGLGCRTTFTEKAKEAGLEILASEPFEAVQKDFRTQWERLLALKPDALFVAGYGPGYVAVLQQLTERTFSGTIMTDFTLTAPPVLKAVSGLSEETLVVAPKISNAFRSEAKRTFRDAAYFVNVATAHDAILLAAEAAQLVREGKAKNILEALKTASNANAALGTVSFNANGDVVVPMEIVTLKALQAEPSEEKSQ
jgi:branched-chain amino acid transport system substrate-binding protein